MVLKTLFFSGFVFAAGAAEASQPVRHPASKREGTAISGGGNGQVAEFLRLARLFHHVSESTKVRLEQNIPAASFSTVMLALKVEATALPLFHEGKRVEAINYPPQVKVRFHAPAWTAKNKTEKYLLVVHELLGLLSIDDLGYKTSENITARSKQILAYEGVDLSRGDEDRIKYTGSSPDPVICKVWPDGYMNRVVVEFTLQPGGGVAAEKTRIDADTTVEVVLSYDSEQQVRVRFARQKNEGMGQTIASFQINYKGAFANLEVYTEKYGLSCSLSSLR